MNSRIPQRWREGMKLVTWDQGIDKTVVVSEPSQGVPGRFVGTAALRDRFAPHPQCTPKAGFGWLLLLSY